MLKILNNPGLQHLVENIFFNLDVEYLQICGLLNQSSKQIFDGPMFQEPMFWLNKFRYLSEENQNDWTNLMVQTEHYTFRRKYAIISYLRWNLNKEDIVDLPYYTNTNVQDNFKKKIKEIFQKRVSLDEDVKILKILAPLTYNVQTEFRSKIRESCEKKELEIVKILAPLTNNPNAPYEYGQTPIHIAAKNGHTEIVKILIPLTDNPIHWATRCGYTKFLSSRLL